MAFPTTAVIDTFARADGALGGNWTTSFGDAAPNIISNAVASSGAGWSGAYWNVAPFRQDCEVFTRVDVPGLSGQKVVVHGRVVSPGSTWNGYGLLVDPVGGASNWSIQRFTSGSGTGIGSAGTQAVAAGDWIGLECFRNVMTAYYKTGAGAWTAVTSATDSIYQNDGILGFEIFNTTARISNFGGGAASLASDTPFPPAGRGASW